MSEPAQTSLLDVGPAAAQPKAKRPRKKPRRTEAEQAHAEAHARLVDLYITEMKRARRLESVVFGPAEGKAIYRLLDRVGGSEARASAIIKHVYSHQFFSTMKSIHDIARDPGRYELGAESRGNRPGDRRQRSSPDATSRGLVNVNGVEDL